LPGERATLGLRDERAFVEFLKMCFSQKRKTLRNNLRSIAPNGRTEAWIVDCGIRADARAEQLGLAEMARLFARVQAG
jgi:16S rRNA (adenine1518-N6/adenine1519-N6)-dimethyltransferase